MNRLLLRQFPRATAPLRVPRAASLLQTRPASTEASSHDRRYIVFDSDISPELAPVLSEIQNKIILPSYINADQRDRIINPKHRQSLKTNPVIIEIDDITHRFDHMPREEMPRTRAYVVKAVSEMKTPNDFANFGRLLDGLRHAGRVIPPSLWNRITRILGSRRQIWVAIEAARQVKKSNFKVSVPVIAHEMLFWTQMKALEAGWERAETEKALRWANVVIEMTALPAHKTDIKRDTQQFPLERDPLVLTTPLHLAAAIAVGHEGGKDVGDKVALLARQLVDVWPKGKSLSDLYTAEQLSARPDFGGVGHVTSPLAITSKLSMALHGMRLAQQVLEPALAEQIRSIADTVQTDLAKHRSSFEVKKGSIADVVTNSLFDESGNIKFDVVAQEAQPEQAELDAEVEESAPATEEK